jgi:hypothetical protein
MDMARRTPSPPSMVNTQKGHAKTRPFCDPFKTLVCLSQIFGILAAEKFRLAQRAVFTA